jgi:hypothetical protein
MQLVKCRDGNRKELATNHDSSQLRFLDYGFHASAKATNPINLYESVRDFV